MFEEKLQATAAHVASLGYTPIYISLHGSQNYGLDVHTDTYQSDYDFKCIVLPSLWDLVEGKRPASLTAETEDGQIDIKDIRVVCDALERMNPAYLESLATKHALILPGGEGMKAIRAQLPELIRQRAARFAQACVGLFENKAKRMCHDSLAAHDRIIKYGYDGKQAHHMYRLLLLLKEFERTGEMRLEAPQEEKGMLMRLKLNEIPLDQIQKLVPQWRALIGTARASKKHGEPQTQALEEIVRLSREMMYAHCVRSRN